MFEGSAGQKVLGIVCRLFGGIGSQERAFGGLAGAFVCSGLRCQAWCLRHGPGMVLLRLLLLLAAATTTTPSPPGATPVAQFVDVQHVQ